MTTYCKNILFPLFAFIMMLSSCDKFLDVQTPDRIMEEDLFSNTAGFRSALNGVYIDMASDVLYGKDMTSGVIDIMAQNYAVTNVYAAYKTFNYIDAGARTYFDSAWQRYYRLIANTNTIIEKSETGNVLSAENKNIILGESLALRAFLHFDVLRLWGPIYSDQTKGNIAIPYNTVAKPQHLPLLTAEKVIDNIIADLEASVKLLEVSDPVWTEGRRNVSDPVNGDFLSFRQFRLNYYAVKALLARVYLWKQDKVNAGRLSLEVISQSQTAHNFFPFVTRDAAVNPTTPDRVFSSEILFAAYDNTRTAMFNTLIGPNAVSFNRVSVATGRPAEMYDDNNDFRYLAFAVQTVGTSSVYYNRKYEPVNSDLDNYVPLIRISEMYFIAAECSATLGEATNLLNKVRAARSARNLVVADQNSLNLAIRNEYRREFLSEGQLFYYYKRKALTPVPDGATNSGTVNITAVNYVVPMVDSEVSQRN